MKFLVAYIEPSKFNDVKQALYAKNIHRLTVTDVFGHSENDGYLESYRGIEIQVDLMKKIKLEIALNDDFVPVAVEAIKKACREGERPSSAGKIFVLPLENVYRIGIDEEGSTAIG